MDSMMDGLPYGGGITVGLSPVNLASAAQNAAYVSLKDVNKFMAIIFQSGVGGAGEDPVLTLSQAKNAAGASAIPLGIEKVFYKVGAPLLNAATDKFVEDTTATRESPVMSYSTALYGGGVNELMVVILVRPVDLLDGYTHIRLQIADVGATQQLGTVMYMPMGQAYSGRNVKSILA